MAKQTLGEITIKLKVSASGHKKVEEFLALIKSRHGVLDIYGIEIVSNDIKHTTSKPQIDHAVKDLNILKKLIMKCIPDGYTLFIKGKKLPCKVHIYLGKVPLNSKNFHGGVYAGHVIMDGSDLKVNTQYRDHIVAMADPECFEKVKKLLDESCIDQHEKEMKRKAKFDK